MRAPFEAGWAATIAGSAAPSRLELMRLSSVGWLGRLGSVGLPSRPFAAALAPVAAAGVSRDKAEAGPRGLLLGMAIEFWRRLPPLPRALTWAMICWASGPS